MARNRPVRVPRPRAIGETGPHPSTYRYRTTEGNGKALRSRLPTDDFDPLAVKLRKRTPAYRYRTTGRNGESAFSRLRTIDLDLLGLERGERILDVGCGSGRHLLDAGRRDCHAVGVELGAEDFRTVKVYLYLLAGEGGLRARVNLLVASGERLPFADGSFDRVVCTEVLEHVPNDRLLVNEFVRVLRPGGTIAVSVPDTYAEAITWWLLALQRFRLEEHLRIYRRRQVVDLLKAVGLQIYTRRYRHSLESLRWLLIWMSVEDEGAVKSISDTWEDFLTDRTVEDSAVLRFIDDIGNHVLPKSMVLYARKPNSGRPA